MSAPAAKALCEPVRTMAPISGWESRVLRAVFSSRIRGVKRAFRALGRLSSTGEMYQHVLFGKMECSGRCEGDLPRPTPFRGVETLMYS